VPVFWPILLMYWVVLFFITMKRQIRHMIKHRYLPFSMGKQVRRYTNPTPTLKPPTYSFFSFAPLLAALTQMPFALSCTWTLVGQCPQCTKVQTATE
jgi:hypothetical protein